MTTPASVPVPRLAVRDRALTPGFRQAPEEMAIALVYGATTHAVLMATPGDLEDLAVGFSFTEGVIDKVTDIAELEVVSQPEGIELRMWLAAGAARGFTDRRRSTLGPTGCGLCGIESLTGAMRQPAAVTSALAVTPDQVRAAVAALRGLPLGEATRAVHAAGLWTPQEGLVVVREDVGRHNALDKVSGALVRDGRTARDGVVVLTSRVSVEMVQKAARIGAPVIAAVSAPTALAVRMAQAAGMTLVAVARDDGFEVFTGPARIGLKAS